MVSGERLAEWVSRLVRIPSVNPEQAGPRAGTPGEALITEAISNWFEDLGAAEVHRREVLPGRSNLYGIWKGETNAWAGIDVHVDTVGVEQMLGAPFSGEVRDGRVWGRGAADTKATLGVTLALLEALRNSGRRPKCNLLVAATVDEEVTAQGAPALADWVRERGIRLDQLAVAEPTLCGPIVAHKGVLRIEFKVVGAPAHSAQPHLGKNAIVGAAQVIAAMDEEHQRLAADCAGGPLGPGTLTVTVIHGGTGANVVPDACAIIVDRRLIPGEDPEEVAGEIIALARDRCSLPVESHIALIIGPFGQDPATPWIRQLAEWSGREPTIAAFCTNAWAYDGLAGECAVIGPGSIDQAHGVEEWVEIAELEKLATIYERWLT